MNTNTPKLANSLYKATSIIEAINDYIAILEATAEPKNIEHAYALRSYINTAINEKHLTKVRSYFNKLFKMLYSNVDFNFTMEARRKSLLSTEKKLCMLMGTGRSPGDIRDFLGFRIIIYGNFSEEELVLKSYTLMEQIILFFIENNFEVCTAEEIDKEAFNSSDYPNNPNIFVPSKSAIDKVFHFAPRIKDYTQYPKANGYQSLHTIIKDTDGMFFELQIRTLNQHIAAEKGPSSHDKHKQNRYGAFNNLVSFDMTKINVPGFVVTNEQEIVADYIGLMSSLLIFHRQKTHETIK